MLVTRLKKKKKSSKVSFAFFNIIKIANISSSKLDVIAIITTTVL